MVFLKCCHLRYRHKVTINGSVYQLGKSQYCFTLVFKIVFISIAY